MGIKISEVTLKSLAEIPSKCRSCSYWESLVSQDQNRGDSAFLKEQWYNATLLDWGVCGKVIWQKKDVLAYAQFAPATYFPRVSSFSAGPVSKDAVLLACLYVSSDLRRKGMGQLLLRAVESDLYKRKVKAVETFANKTKEGKPAAPPEFFLKNGFYILKEDPQFPLMRLDLKTSIPWRENLQSLLESFKIPSPPISETEVLLPL